MNKEKLMNIGRGTLSALTVIVSVLQIVDFTSTMVSKYRKPKKVEGFTAPASNKRRSCMKEKSTDYLELLTALGEGFRGSL